jgi:hypothetical protein
LILSIKEATRDLCCSKTSLKEAAIFDAEQTLGGRFCRALGHQVCLATACLAESATNVLFRSTKSDMIWSSSMSSDQQTLICRKLAPGRTQSFPFGIIPLFVVSDAEVVIRVVIGCLGCLGVGDFGHQSVRILKSSISVYKNCKCQVWCKEEGEAEEGRQEGRR